MKNYFLLFIFFLITLNCSLNKVVKHHGVHFLEKKQEKISIQKSNKNDVEILLGPASTKSSFNNDIWIYIERKTTVSELKTLGRKKILVNNVLFLEINDRGMVVDKKFYNKEDMNSLKISKNETNVLNKKDSFIRNVLVSLRQKINDPLGKRKAK
jgi:outer membrane protein assembly factor BamE (lipoprotein component of BamABCDE complex)